MRRALLLLCALLLFVAASAVSGYEPVRLDFYGREFVWLYVGYPGEWVPFRVRWDVAGVYALASTLAKSRSYSLATASDMLCFAGECVRVPITPFTGEPAAPVDEPDAMPVSGHRGVLGLAAGSPVRLHFPWIHADASALTLYRQQPAPPGGALAGAAVATLNRQPALIAVDLVRCYSTAPAALAAAHRWRLDLGRHRVDVDLRRQYVETEAGGVVPMVLRDHFAANGSANASVVIGRLLAFDMFGIATGPSGAVEWLVVRADSAAQILLRDNAFLALALVAVTVAWAVGVHDDTWIGRVAETQRWPDRFVLHYNDREYQTAEPLPAPPTPPALERLHGPFSLRTPGFGAALWAATTAGCAAVVALALLGADLKIAPWAAYGAAATIGVLCACAGTAAARSSVGAPCGAAAATMALWLLMLTVQCDQGVVLAVIASGLTAQIVCTRLVLAAALGTPWRNGGTRAARLLWLTIAGATAVAVNALIGVYGALYLLDKWWPTHPAKPAVPVLYVTLASCVAAAACFTEYSAVLDLLLVRITRCLALIAAARQRG